MSRIRGILSRGAAGAPAFLAEIALSCLGYGVGFLFLYPVAGPGARVMSFPFVVFWAIRRGVPGGLLAAMASDLVLGDGLAMLTGRPAIEPGALAIYVPINLVVGATVGVLGSLRRRLRDELAGRKQVETRLRESEETYRFLFAANPCPMWVCDAETRRFLAVNDAAVRHYGYSAEDFAALTDDDLVPDVEPDVAGPRRARKHRRSDGVMLDVEIISRPVDFRGRESVLVLANDVTERARALAAMEHEANHDTLTGLPNRSMLGRALERALADSTATGAPVSVLMLDLDHFKLINDTLGHLHGDEVLRHASARLREATGDRGTLARFAGDEFALVLPGADAEAARDAARPILAALQAPILHEGHGVAVGASVGIAVAPGHGNDPWALLRCADVAMYRAKRSRAGALVYDPALDDNSPQRLALASELRRAIDSDELVLHYQPKVDVRTGRVYGVEALVRWQHPTEGLLPPGKFLPLVDQVGLDGPLNLWIFRTALRQCARWLAEGRELDVSVNLSPTGLRDGSLLGRIGELLEATSVPPSWLTVEITEDAMMADPASAKEMLGRLRELGPRVSIDDFGTGHSSLSYLMEYPVDEVKIDRSFIRGAGQDRKAGAIVRAIVDLGRRLDFEVVAEGIEDEPTLARVASLGCEFVQGYYLARPMPPETFEAWLDARTRAVGLLMASA